MNSAAAFRPVPGALPHGVTGFAKPLALYPVFSCIISSSSSTDEGQVGAAAPYCRTEAADKSIVHNNLVMIASKAGKERLGKEAKTTGEGPEKTRGCKYQRKRRVPF